MDPNATWQKFLTALADWAYEEMQEALDDLWEWVSKDGFLPESVPDIRVIENLRTTYCNLYILSKLPQPV